MADPADRRIALLSVRPRFARAILDGSKTVELRRQPPTASIGSVLLYATSPVGLVLGTAEVAHVHDGAPSAVWERWQGLCGVTRAEFRAYFAGSRSATAIVLAEPRPFDEPLPLSYFGVRRAPQNFVYVDSGCGLPPERPVRELVEAV